MKVKEIGEVGVISNIKKWLTDIETNKDIIGIGDDAAVIPFRGTKLLVSTDALIEGTHFTKDTSSFYDLGWKSLAVNVSDIAAMGGKAKFAVISFACSPDTDLKDLKEFYEGFKELADITGVVLIGGDTVKSEKQIMVSVSIIGEVYGNKPILRSGARQDDYICVTGFLGDAAKGLENLLNNKNEDNIFTRKLKRPMPRFKEGLVIAEHELATSMMDISDGLVATLYEMCGKKGFGFDIFYDKIPVSKELNASSDNFEEYALYGGEDYELVFTTRPARLEQVKKFIDNVTIIGRVVEKDGINFIREDGSIVPVKKKGYDAY